MVMKKQQAALKCNGFHVMKVHHRLLPFLQVLYVKLHRSKKAGEEALPGDRTLFVANATMEEEELRSVFEQFGSVEAITTSDKKKKLFRGRDRRSEAAGGGTAHVVFKQRSACEAVLKSCSPLRLEEEDETGKTGLKAWMHDHRSKNMAEDSLQAHVDACMAAFDSRTEPLFPKRQKSFKICTGFRSARKRREQLVALRNKFEADKKRVEAMKTRRQFKPF
ncbi:hypothetical protein GUITHDRAFT_166902 [Guillardia theta CCMP2712]|uniref:RRM domain-containing protein n=1 Tax=Guillardia theta (strain CCMP2712) TaxID=905079 RepID=L1I658_GUITC|nr:hypothetical protein GUITHDRAFT_166902 [Guillardia theta CCMP2712]EKX31354.1 hypothetical protein GUITHDRAFT_166902 [Guillardia theta CCMP2712]|eukprot:XP_005818334.1 hypothetical protein GUITHDRAFT_166902 [Guillardia theta CCMP2712]